MRAGDKHGPLGPLEPAIRAVEGTFLEAVRLHTTTIPRQVMLGDATITSQDTFDAAGVDRMFERVAAGLDGWQARDVTTTNNEDIRRVFVKFSTQMDGYSMSGHFSLQFHVLLYYMPEQRVMDCQRNLARVIDEAKSGEEQLADASNDIISEDVRAKGEGDISEMEIFERLYRDESLVERLESKLEGALDADLRRLAGEKRQLLAELDGLLTEVYQTVPVLIDDARLVTGEEGCLCTFDVERSGGGSMPDTLEEQTVSGLRERLAEVLASLKLQTRKSSTP